MGKLPAVVEPDEELTSFVRRDNEVDRSSETIRTIRHVRLMPRRNGESGRLELSVCRSGHLSEAELWSICARFFDPHNPKPAIGRGVGRARVVYGEQLGFDADGEPYAEHANVIGWHDEAGKPDSELKHFWIEKAQRMAAQFAYKPRA